MIRQIMLFIQWLMILIISISTFECEKDPIFIQINTLYGNFTVYNDSIAILKNPNMQIIEKGKIKFIKEGSTIYFNVFNREMIKYDLAKKQILNEILLNSYKDLKIDLKNIDDSFLLLLTDTKIYVVSKRPKFTIKYSILDSLFKQYPYLRRNATSDWKLDITNKKRWQIRIPQSNSKEDFIKNIIILPSGLSVR